MTEATQPNPLLTPQVTVRRLADIFGEYALKSKAIKTIRLNPMDFYQVRQEDIFDRSFDRETGRKLIQSGIMGYFWGAVIQLDAQLTLGEITVVTEKDADSAPQKSVAVLAVDRIRTMGGFYGLDEKQTDDLADDLASFLASMAALRE